MSPEDLGGSEILLDTGVFSTAISNRPPYDFYEPFLANRFWLLSFATVAELRYGALNANWGDAKRQELERRIELCVVLPGNDAVSTAWAMLNRKFKDQIGVNDLWIAATALAHVPTLPIATLDKTLWKVADQSGITVVCQQ